MAFSRRQFFTIAGATAATLVVGDTLKAVYAKAAQGKSLTGSGYGPLNPDPDKLLDLPDGFKYRAFSRTGDIMADDNPVPGGHDGMAM